MTTNKGLAGLSLKQLEEEFETLEGKVKKYQHTVAYGQRINDQRYSAIVNRLDAITMLIQRKKKKYEEHTSPEIQGREDKQDEVGQPA